jgi:uncharacterized protein
MSREYGKIEKLRKELEELPPLHRVAFAASICERLFFNYVFFVKRNNWGNPSLLKAALDEIWQVIEGKTVDAEALYQLEEDCAAISPDADDFCDTYSFEAQETVIALCNTLRLCLDPTPDRAIGVAEVTEEVLHGAVLFEKEDVNPEWSNVTPFEEQEKEISKHPFTVREMAKQNEDLQRLKEIDTLDREFLDWLRYSNNNDGKSLIDLG